MKKIIGIIILLIVSLFLYGKYIEPNSIAVHEYTIKNEKIKDSYKELKFVHFSDILYDKNSKKLEKISKKINDLQPDIIIFSGDLFAKDINYKEDDYNNLKDFLNSLSYKLFKYAIIGNEDIQHLDKYKDILYETNFNLLDNDSKLLFYKDENPINIIGISDTKSISELLNNDVSNSFTIAITHKPDNFLELKNYDIDLVLAGHSLGGIINVPYYGGLIKTEGANTYINNHYSSDGKELYISNGLGYKNFEFRLFNSPAINVYRLDN